MVASEKFSVHSLPFRCEVSLSSAHPAIDYNDLVRVEAEFDPAAGE